jgi:pyrroline-5-carboxylate reductase
MLTAGFVGGGRITRILVGGWARDCALPGRILVHEPDREAAAALADVGPAIEFVSASAVAAADVVFLAVHPPALVAAAAGLKPSLGGAAVLVSLAPKIPIAAIEHATGTNRIARMIPNAASLVSRGYNPITFGIGLDRQARRSLLELVAAWGRAPEVPEEQLEAYAILTAMGPTYLWYQWQALREVSVALGLSATATDVALRQMVEGALATLLDAGLTPQATMDLVPVKPLAELEPAVAEAYRTALPALHAKIRPTLPAVV